MKPKKNTHNMGGRKPKQDPAVHRYGIKLTGDENFRFRQMFEQSGLDCYSKFIKAVLFKREIKVVKVDKTTLDLLYSANTILPAVPSRRQQLQSDRAGIEDELRGEAYLADALPAGTITIELLVLSKHINTLTQDYERRWLQR